MIEIKNNKYVSYASDEIFEQAIINSLPAKQIILNDLNSLDNLLMISSESEVHTAAALTNHKYTQLNYMDMLTTGMIGISGTIFRRIYNIFASRLVTGNSAIRMIQSALATADGWVSLDKDSNLAPITILNKNKKVGIRLIPSLNSLNSSSTYKNRKELEEVHSQNPEMTLYLGYINPRGKKTSGLETWSLKGFNDNPFIRQIWGAQLFEFVTDNPLALHQSIIAIHTIILTHYDFIPDRLEVINKHLYKLEQQRKFEDLYRIFLSF